MIRKPVVAGQFYPQTEASLKKMLASLVDTASEKQDAKGLILPHAGYVYSGPVAGATISKVAVKKTVVILGADHTGSGSPFSVARKDSWLTPLGEVKIDTEIAEAILRSGDLLKDDSQSHANEHSIEVELPFLQYVRSDVKIVPIIVSRADVKKYQQLAADITEGLKKVGRSVTLVASTDFTHYESRESAEAKDRLAIEAILSLDEEKLSRVVQENRISMCGAAPTCVLLAACKNIGAKHAGLVKYQTSGDITGDYSSVVGYAGMVIW
ncbi:MAG: AmmeMemoRadiSam system protein B [Candidatus Omnitrophica bacterium]|nr:AmmeMemoRadiSam system protein B [Candidatus Omnitrophota bacterium]